jgi:chorismate mutase/prephenate dehydratase
VEEGVIMENAIESIRKEIDGIDGELLALFVRRMEAAGKMAEVKRALGRPVLDPARERSILTRVTEAAGPELENEARLLFTTLMAISRGSQRAALSDASPFAKELAAAAVATGFPSTATVACPGAEGSYSQQAACRLVNVPSILYFKGFDDVFSAVEKGMCDYGVLPIENSAVGSVTSVYDLMAEHRFSIVRAVKVRVRHVLMAPRGTRLSDVREITSHPHALAQCSAYLRTLTDVRTVPAANTAVAAAAERASPRKAAPIALA